MKIVDLKKARRQRQAEKEKEQFNAAADAIENMKNDFDVVIDSTVQSLQRAGMSEENAIKVIVTHLSDLVMAHDIKGL